MKKVLFLATILLIGFSSCRTVFIQFDKEDTDVVPSDDNFYRNVKSYCITTGNQNIVYDSKELTSGINTAIATIENEFMRNGLKVVKENADVTIKLISVDLPTYSTNKAYKPNGNEKQYDCNFSFKGIRIFLTAIKGDDFVNYTFYHTPCSSEDGCEYKIDRHCNLTPVNGDASNAIAYELNSKNNPSIVEAIAKDAARQMINRIKKNR